MSMDFAPHKASTVLRGWFVLSLASRAGLRLAPAQIGPQRLGQPGFTRCAPACAVRRLGLVALIFVSHVVIVLRKPWALADGEPYRVHPACREGMASSFDPCPGGFGDLFNG